MRVLLVPFLAPESIDAINSSLLRFLLKELFAVVCYTLCVSLLFISSCSVWNLRTGVTIYAEHLAFLIWNENLRSEKSKSWAMNVGGIWHEFLHLSLYLKNKPQYCYSEAVHKTHGDMSKWLMYDKNLKLVKPEPYGYYLKQYWYAIQPKPSCTF